MSGGGGNLLKVSVRHTRLQFRLPGFTKEKYKITRPNAIKLYGQLYASF